MPADPIVQLDEVSYVYPGADRAALLNISLAIGPGEIVGIVGATGSGKTTLCLALNGIAPQFFGGRFFGRALVSGLDTLETPIRLLAGRVGIVMQDPDAQLLTSSVENEVAFALENSGVPREEMRRRVDEALAAVRLGDLAQRHPATLSGGQKQRLALAAVLAQNPALVVLDEPTAQLDPRASAEVFALVRELNRSRGTTFVIASHASEELAETAGRIVVLSRGEVRADGSPETVFRDSALCEREHVRPPDVTRAFSLLSSRQGGGGVAPIRLEDALKAVEGRAQALAIPVAGDSPGLIRPPLLVLQGVSYRYANGTEALRGVTLTINRGDYVVLIGQNGAGKSTLLKHILGLLQPDEGTVAYDGGSIAGLGVGAVAQRIGYVGQNPDRQLFSATVEAEVAFGLGALRLGEHETKGRVTKALRDLGLEAFRSAHPLSLSKGDRARVVIASALAMEPEVLVFDEHTTGQDEEGSRRILDVTRELHRAGKTVIVVTHHLNLMPGYAERAVVMGEGRVLMDSSLREAYNAMPVLAATDLAPIQIVRLARAMDPRSRVLTADEWVELVTPSDRGGRQ